MGPHPAVAQVRLGVRRSLAGLSRGELVLAACSGGADSLALAAALAVEAPRLGLRAGGITVDHGLQQGSAQRAEQVTRILAGLRLDPVHSVAVAVARRQPQPGGPPYRGPEAAAREARYAALAQAAAKAGAAAIALGHTLDDQAESVLLGLARGSGARSLAGMAPRSGRYLRPLLGVRRTSTRAACAVLHLDPWEDPHNTDSSYARARVRGQLLPILEEVLGPGVTEALARSAGQLRADADTLDCLAAAQAQRLAGPDGSLPADGLAELPAAIRTRILRAAALAAGSPAGALGARHVHALDALVTGWHGQRGTDLPGGLRCRREYGRLLFSPRA
ncbi:MAG TPA: tRNA lysidine(34) synthetase TilS [Streptosporangiaceae bacterium]|nr:tRNA lysidine(34) synthetase TilS [Streptosporangiaceae bacterium]